MNGRVLLVEDDQAMGEMLEVHLRRRGFFVILQPSAEQSLAVWRSENSTSWRAGAPAGKAVLGFSSPAAERLLRYPWPGNVRELQNTVEPRWCSPPSIVWRRRTFPTASERTDGHSWFWGETIRAPSCQCMKSSVATSCTCGLIREDRLAPYRAGQPRRAGSSADEEPSATRRDPRACRKRRGRRAPRLPDEHRDRRRP
jgi:hypothetical protein